MNTAGESFVALRISPLKRVALSVEFQQISISHPAVKDILAIQNNTAPNRFGLFAAEGLWAAKVVTALLSTEHGLRAELRRRGSYRAGYGFPPAGPAH